MALDIYHYHPKTHEFLCEGKADPDPLVEGNWLIPAKAVTVAPPEIPEGQAAVWTGEEWTLVEDHRGKVVWIDHETQIEIKELGPLPNNIFEEQPAPPPPSPEELRVKRNEKLRQAQYSGFGGPTMKDVFNV